MRGCHEPAIALGKAAQHTAGKGIILTIGALRYTSRCVRRRRGMRGDDAPALVIALDLVRLARAVVEHVAAQYA